jgi:hypothetical protein
MINPYLLTLLEQKHPVLALHLKQETFPRHVIPQRGSLSPNSIQGAGVLFVDRWGSLASLEDLTVWLLAGERKVVLIERSYADVFAFLTLPEAQALLEHPAFSCHIQHLCDEAFFFKTAWESLFLPQYFLSFADEEFVQWKALMQHALDLTFLIASEYRDYGKKVAENFYRNLQLVSESSVIHKLSFQGVPALICGAGPSIACDLQRCHHLKQRALVFAGGALLSVCADQGLIPHLGALIDPDPPYERFKHSTLFEIPLLYQMRLSHSILTLMHGPKLLAASSGEWPLESCFLDSLGIPTLESGWNVANFMATLAAEMGCSPIILLGMDMSYAPQQEYLQGIDACEEKGEVVVTTQQGVSALSRKDLLMGKTFFSELVQRYPDQVWINATREGLLIEGMHHGRLEELPAMQYDFEGWLYAQRVEECVPRSDKMLFKKTAERLKESFSVTVSILERLLVKLEKSYLLQKDHLSKTYDGVRLALEESDLEDEIAYQWILQPLWQVWRWVFFRERQEQIKTLEGKIKQVLFFREVIQEHHALFDQIYSIRI